MKEFFQYLIEEYSEPVVGYPEDHRRLTLISRKENVCWISIFYLFYKAWIFFSTNTTTWGLLIKIGLEGKIFTFTHRVTKPTMLRMHDSQPNGSKCDGNQWFQT